MSISLKVWPRSAILFAFVSIFFLALPLTAAEKVHYVKKGETIRLISRRYGVSEVAISRRNHLSNPNQIGIGQRIIIPIQAPGGFRKHVVQKGETIALIARRTGVAQSVLISYNKLKNPDKISPGQVLKIPLAPGSADVKALSGPQLGSKTKAALDRIRVSKRWRYVVIHHSGSFVDTIAGMNTYHIKRGMENGLAYHFVIGNGRKGTGLSDGGIYIGNRWKKQLDGGHVASTSLNSRAVGICLVGDFNKRKPSARQIASLHALSNYLVNRCKIKRSRVKTHREINPKPTACPGKLFPSESFRVKLGT